MTQTTTETAAVRRIAPADSEYGEGSGGTPATWWEATLVNAYLIALAALLLYGLLVLWPGPTPAGTETPAAIQPVLFFWGTVSVTDEVRLLLLVALTGALGGIVHAMRSVSWYIGQQQLMRNWLPTYVTLPFVGTTLAVLFYLVIRGGFFSPQASFQQTSTFGFAAMAGIIGLFSSQAVLKLKEVAEIVLTRPPQGKDAAPPRASRADGTPGANPIAGTNGALTSGPSASSAETPRGGGG